MPSSHLPAQIACAFGDRCSPQNPPTCTPTQVEQLWGDEFNWGSSLANSIMAARPAFDERGEPFLIVRSDYLYDWRLLYRMARVSFRGGIEAFALVDTAKETVEWISGAHCTVHCKNGHCHALVKVGGAWRQ